MRTALKVITILHLVAVGLVLFSNSGDYELLIGSLMYSVAPILTLIYLGQEKK